MSGDRPEVPITGPLKNHAAPVLARYPEGRQRSAVMPLLRLAQERDGWVSSEAITEVGEIIGLSSAEVLAVASFYIMFHKKPKGRHVISICQNLACSMLGAEEVIEEVEHHLGIGSEGETTPDGAFTLERAECLAHCELAPCVQIDYDRMLMVTPDSMLALLEELRSLPGPDGPR